jgi:aminopeptidase N
LGRADRILGAPLTIVLPEGARQVRIRYATSPNASGLQWLEPPQTAGGEYPFLYSQSQAIHARSWIPTQDSPGVRTTYTARIHATAPLAAVMSAEGGPAARGEFSFSMPQPIPSYLIALAVGRLAFRATGPRTGVYAEPPMLDRAARELEDLEKLVAAVESLYGPYRWGRYDVLICPPSFPIGGMENPRLTFASPTILAGDKSLVSLISHELAHSWSGNLVTNAAWSDFWLNEGFTTYLERRIQEKVYGRERSEMEALLEVGELKEEMAKLAPRDQILHVDLTGRDPDDGFTLVPYVKGMLFLRRIEETVGRKDFDAFLRRWFDEHAFRSAATGEFVEYLRRRLPEAMQLPVDEWLYQPGMPESAPQPVSDALVKVEALAARWAAGEVAEKDLPVKRWTTQEWLHFLRSLDARADSGTLKRLDAAFRLTESGNAAILCQWLRMAVRAGYRPADAAVEKFLLTVGRRKFVKPLYEELMKTPAGAARARAVFARARPRYHPITAAALDGVFRPKQ